MSFCSWSCLSLYFGIKTVIFCYGTSIKFELCKYLISNRISYEKNENQDLQVVSYYVALLLAYTSWILFIFILSVFEAFLLSLLHCCWMDDDLEFCLVMVLIMLVAVRKKWLPWNLKFYYETNLVVKRGGCVCLVKLVFLIFFFFFFFGRKKLVFLMIIWSCYSCSMIKWFVICIQILWYQIYVLFLKLYTGCQ